MLFGYTLPEAILENHGVLVDQSIHVAFKTVSVAGRQRDVAAESPTYPQKFLKDRHS